MSHVPVMLKEVLEYLKPADGEIYVDGTFGAGGYTRAFLEAADCTVIAIDRDPGAAERELTLKKNCHSRESGNPVNVNPDPIPAYAGMTMKGKSGERLIFIHGCFGDVEKLLKEKVDAFVLDLGVSSMQIDQPERGFSFRADGPLDMRMDNTQGRTASDIVNQTGERELADIIYQYGEERLSRRIAKKIIERRKEKKFFTTADLAAVIRSVVPRSKDGIDPATRTFQALRIAVNDELGELDRALAAAEKILRPGGRLIVVSFHSLEDARVKNFLRGRSGQSPKASRYAPPSSSGAAVFRLLTRKAIKPSEEEQRANPRARSARLRAAVREAA